MQARVTPHTSARPFGLVCPDRSFPEIKTKKNDAPGRAIPRGESRLEVWSGFETAQESYLPLTAFSVTGYGIPQSV